MEKTFNFTTEASLIETQSDNDIANWQLGNCQSTERDTFEEN